MDRPFHVSCSTAQFVRRRLPNCENVAYSILLRTTALKGERTKGQVSYSRGTSKDDKVNISGQWPSASNSLKLAATPVTWKTKHYNHYLRLDGQRRLSDPSRRGILSRSRYHVRYMPLGQCAYATSAVCSFAPNGYFSGRYFSTSTASSAVLENHQVIFNRDSQPPFHPHEPVAKEPKIRESLRLWDAEHRAQLSSEFEYEKPPSELYLGKHDPADTFDEGRGEYDFDDTLYRTYERGDIVDLGNQRPFLLRGDMVELRASNCFRVELAIFVRSIGLQYQYYTMSGKWIHQKSRLAKYCVPGFVDAEEVDPLLAFLPSKAVPEALQHKLQSFEHALPRDVGSPLIKKMLDFWRESDKVYRETAFNLDNAHKLVAHKFNMRYATLAELAHKLLPKKYMKDGDFPAPVLYALHRSLMLDELGFSPQKWSHRISNQFKISPAYEIDLIRSVGDDIRRYQEHLIDSVQGVKQVKSNSTARFLKFIKKARHIIRESRRTRQYTPHGMIGPAERRSEDESDRESSDISKDSKYFDRQDWRYIRFITSWAALRTVQNISYLHGAASTILRATGMYDDNVLDQRVGWTFLQEIGAIAPWENRVHFDMRLPSVTSRIMPPEKLPKGIQTLNTDLDVLDGLRKDWGSLPVYCIDDIDANEIDDGVSIEPTDLSDEYWIHVHVADPASMIEPRSVIAQNAMSAMRTIYLPHRVIGMLPSDIVQDHLSLAPDRRCLTFSARINCNGTLIDTKVTPGVLHNIIYMTPATLSTVIGETPSAQETATIVGDNNAPPATKCLRPVLESHEMTESDKRNLRLLHTLGNARQSVSSAKGSVMFNSPSLQISVVTDDDSMEHKKPSNYLQCTSDPRIHIKAERQDPNGSRNHGSTVMNLMLLAGEVSARWCQERGIPVINRVSQPHPDDPDPREYFHRVIMPLMKQLKEPHVGARNSTGDDEESDITLGEKTCSSPSQAEDVIAPHLSETSRILPLNIALEYQRLLGTVVPSTTPGPHLHLGLDMFSRTTSPLRRYSDMLVHWQIEAALLEEARSGQSLIGSAREDYLPFKKDEIDRLLPIMDRREKDLVSWQRDAQRVWAMQLLLRAWKFNEAPLPPTFELWTHTIESKSIRGELTYFGGLSATFILPSWLPNEDVQIGDVFEVRLRDLDIYNGRIDVEPLRRIRRTAERAI